MAGALKTEDAIKLFVEHKTHARHLESYLLSFTQVFLLVTGALWGYALARSSTANQQQFQFVGVIIFSFHFFYSVLGSLFTVRLSANFRTHYEAAGLALRDAGLEKYVVLVHPENAEGELKTNSIPEKLRLLLTAKAYFLLIYIGAAAIDTYYVGRVQLGMGHWRAIGSAVGVFVLLVLIGIVVYRFCQRDIRAADSTIIPSGNSGSVKPTP